MSDPEQPSTSNTTLQTGNTNSTDSQNSTALVEVPVTIPSPVVRDELLAKARAFLASPHIQHQDNNSKRTFLREKGLAESEVDELLKNYVCFQVKSAPNH